MLKFFNAMKELSLLSNGKKSTTPGFVDSNRRLAKAETTGNRILRSFSEGE
jgi:hypothetical protein